MSTTSAAAWPPPATASSDSANVATLFAGMGIEHAHQSDGGDLSRDFTDAGACLLCRAGWCMQRLTVTPGQTSGVVRHGLIVH